MSYTVDFSRDGRGNYNIDNSFTSIIYGSDALYVEDTLNEMQWLQYVKFTEFLRNLSGSGVFHKNIDAVGGMYTHDTNNLIDYSVGVGGSPVFKIGNMGVSIAGHIAYLKDINLTDEGREVGVCKIKLPISPSTGERYDVVYLESWLEEVNQNSVLFKNGCEGAESLYNIINVENRFPDESETDRRVQLKSRLIVKSNVSFEDNNTYGLLDVRAKGGNSVNTNLAYRYLDKGNSSNIFVAGNGDNYSKNVLNSVDGYCYSMTLFKIRRDNQNINIETDVEDMRLHISNSGDLFELINSHIGNRGNSHGLADNKEAGFLSAELYQKLINIEAGATADMTGEEITRLLNLCKDILHANRLIDAGDNLLTAEDFERSFNKKTGFNKDFGSSAGTVAQGNDSRFLSTVQKSSLVSGINSNLHYHSDDRKWSNLTGVPDRFESVVFTVNNTSSGAYAILNINGANNGQSLGILPLTHNFANLGSISKSWNGIYGSVMYENGTRLDGKYAKIASTTQNITVGTLTSHNNITSSGNVIINVGKNIQYSHSNTIRSMLSINTTGTTLSVGNTIAQTTILSKGNPTANINGTTRTFIHTGNDSAYVKYTNPVSDVTFNIGSLSLNGVTRGIKWLGSSDNFGVFVQKYEGSENHQLVIECGDNTGQDRTVIQHKNESGGITQLSIFSTSGNVSKVMHTFENRLFAKNHSDGKNYQIIDSSARIWRAIYQDLAELWEKDPNAELEAGDVMVIGSNGLLATTKDCDTAVVGVYSDTFGMCLGGDGESIESIVESGKSVPIGIAGKVLVKVVGDVKVGDLLVTSSIRGKARALRDGEDRKFGTILGKSLENYNSSDEDRRIWMLIMNV